MMKSIVCFLLVLAFQASAWSEDALSGDASDGGTKPRGEESKTREQKTLFALLDFETENAFTGKKTTHPAEVTLTEDVPETGGRFAAKIVAGFADAFYFGAGFPVAAADLSSAGSIRFWIKTDIASRFNLQLHSDNGHVSVVPFSTTDLDAGWNEVVLPISSARKPPWSKAEADLGKITFIQFTAFGSGPYAGKSILLDAFSFQGIKGASFPENVASDPGAGSATFRARSARLREPSVVKRGEEIDMFDGETLDGWRAIPRIYVPRNPYYQGLPREQLFDAVVQYYEESDGSTNRVPNRQRIRDTGVWEINEGVVTGGQSPGSICGAYLMSEKTYGDFELTLEANPDYPIDTGIMVRAHELGSVGFQVLVDNRPNGTIGGVFGNSIGSFFAYPFVFQGDEEPGNQITHLRAGDPDALRFRGGQFKTDYAATLETFQEVWKPNDWNEIKIRCTGSMPLIETWINGVPIAKLDTATLREIVPGYDPEAILNRIGRKGHIGLEVHDSPTRDRWAPGAKCRWRNVRIRELQIDASKDPAIPLTKMDGRHWWVDSAGKPFFAHGITHVGNLWCNPVDTSKGFQKAGVKQGFFAEGLASRPGLHDAVRRVNLNRDQVTPGSLEP
ncbi:MAG: DUF1080 domain-containing protein [Planctomycetota bacterium]